MTFFIFFFMSLTILNTLGTSLKISSFCTGMCQAAGAAPNGSFTYLYLPNCHAKVIKYHDLLSNFMVWYPEPTSITVRLCTIVNLGNMSLAVGPLCTSLYNVWLSLASSAIWPGYEGRALCHSDVSFTSSGTVICCCCRHSYSFFKGSCGVHAIYQGRSWYGFTPPLTYKENMPFKHSIPEKNIIICIFHDMLALAAMSASFWEPVIK